MPVWMWIKSNPYALLVELQIGAATMKNSMEVFQKTKNRTNYHMTSNSTSDSISKGRENTNLKSYLHPHVHSSITYKSQDIETTQV